MSEWQGRCAVLPNDNTQLTSGMRMGIVSAATIYNEATPRQKFASAADYIQYKKARVLAGSGTSTGRPPQSAAIAGLVCRPTS